MTDTKDALIIGGGPAGLSAALTMARQRQTCVIFDSGSYRNGISDYMHLIPGFDHKHPSEYLAASRENILDRYPTVSIEKVSISTIKKNEDGTFEATDTNETLWRSKKLVLASGVDDIMPKIDGYEECWGKGIFHCLFCKGYEEAGCSSSGVLAIESLAMAPFALHVARQASALSESVTIYTNGETTLAENIVSIFGSTSRMKTDARPIKSFRMGGSGAEVVITFTDGSEVTEGFLAHAPRTTPKGSVVKELSLEQTPSGDIKAGPPFYETSVKGVFAAGDVCSPMKNIPNAIFSGNLAGTGASSQIMAEAHGQKSLFG
ncbi:hypothetical protein BDV95DRAFT_546689 [Massariosphaeria phaeospora]|uniref:FAD/NAD(P)-binding domain-containing protein n=1 Tax=Massariosphaeria phaeospora TaxID=100035 RepID=A0A7C8I356_9PLEO|nr:hypothetical protein BDV95DRAFT_546689 [Massariosphaeria phaeospora]